MDTFFHSVNVDESKCAGCVNCIKRCPTEAIRIRNGKSRIREEFCVDCGECVRHCPRRAKTVTFDPISSMSEYKYKVALPPPSLYAQFNNVDDKSLILEALKIMGFDDVFEVALGAEMVSEMTRFLLRKKKYATIISSACPSVMRLIRVRFPALLDNLSPIVSPMELSAKIAAENAFKKTGLPREKIGLFFISPCPAKVASVYAPLGSKKSHVDRALSMSDVYPPLLAAMKKVDLRTLFAEPEDSGVADTAEKTQSVTDLPTKRPPPAGRIGVSWAREGGEAAGLLTERYLSADGIENVIRVLEDLEDEKLRGLDFIELNACVGGCVGGVMAVENPYIAKVKVNNIRKFLPVSGGRRGEVDFLTGKHPLALTEKIEYQPVFRLGETMSASM